MSDECKETYYECTRARHQRVIEVVQQAQPGDTVKEMAVRAGVTTRTIENIRRELLQKAKAFANCNNGGDKPQTNGHAEDDEYEWPACVPKDLPVIKLNKKQLKLIPQIKRHFKTRRDTRVLHIMMMEWWPWLQQQ